MMNNIDITKVKTLVDEINAMIPNAEALIKQLNAYKEIVQKQAEEINSLKNELAKYTTL